MALELENTTKLQRIAADPKNCAWVFASAGSGKTQVLTNRVLRLLLDFATPKKILCLTFTKIAAIEMQERITAALASWVICDEQELQEKLANLLGRTANSKELQTARILFAKTLEPEGQMTIQTIHSFCQNLVKIFPFEAAVRPDFELLDENSEKLLLQKCKKEVFTESLQNKQMRHIISHINSKLNDENFAELIGKMLAQKENFIFLQQEFFTTQNIIDKIFAKFGVEKNEELYSVDGHSHQMWRGSTLEKEEDLFANFLQRIDFSKLAEMAQNLENSAKKTDQKTAKIINDFLRESLQKNYANFQSAFLTKDFEAKKISSILTQNFLHYENFVADLQKIILDFLEQINSYKIANNTACLLLLMEKILAKYTDIKKQNSLIDYNDLIIKVNNLLKNYDGREWVKFRMDGFFDHILVDESQDTNHHQWAIIKALTEDFFSGETVKNNNRTIFIIGDDKQSIYSFQGSEPNISQEIFAYYQEKLRDNPVKLNKIDLQYSFRSLAKILSATDLVFANKKLMGSLDYQEHRAIRTGEGKVEIMPIIIPKKTTKEKSDSWQFENLHNNFSNNDLAAQEFLTELIALRIKGWIAAGKKLEGFDRSINYDDIMILLRNRTNGFEQNLRKSFTKHQLPFFSAKTTSCADELIIQDLLAAAKFALLPHDDLNLACLLKSPFFLFDENKLLEICTIKNAKNISLYEAIKLEEKSFGGIFYELENIIKKSRQLNCFEFFESLLSHKKSEFCKQFKEEELQILDKFMVIISNYCQNNLPILQQFVDFVLKTDPKIAMSTKIDNQIKISTVHAAKGLQAPIVFLPDCNFNFNQQKNARESLLLAVMDENNSTAKFPIWCAKKSEENNLFKFYKSAKNEEARQEEARLLYVALTRAQNEVYIAGAGNASDEKCWYEIVKNSLASKARKIDFIKLLDEESANFFVKNINNFTCDNEAFEL